MSGTRKMLLALAAACMAAAPVAVLAHHGWAWTEDQESRLAGTIEQVSLGNPHAHLKLRNEKGVWEVDLAPPSATERAGFVADSAAVGDKASMTGHRSKDPSELVFKAETITVKGKTYDVYPNRPKSLKPGKLNAVVRETGIPRCSTKLWPASRPCRSPRR